MGKCVFMRKPCQTSSGEQPMNATCCRRTLLLSLLVLFIPKATQAQTTYDALRFGPGIDSVGYSEAAGWTFVPVADLHVVTVGCFPTAPPSSIGICFWEGTNRIIALYQISINQEASGDVSYQPVDGLTLKAGSPYAISINPNQIPLPLRIYSKQGADGLSTFTTTPFISHFADYLVSTNGEWTPEPVPPASNTDFLYFGPTFQFQLLQELTLAQTGNNLVLSWPTQSVTYVVQRAETLNNANWVTLTNVPVTVGSQKQVTIPSPEGTKFFRLASQ